MRLRQKKKSTPLARWRSAREERFDLAVKDLLGGMSPQYASLCYQDTQQSNEARERGIEYVVSNFTEGIYQCVEDHVDFGRPLAMPDVVAAFYVANPKAKAGPDCEDCGYQVPWLPTGGLDDPGHPFKRCPLCGGRVTSYGFNLKRGRQHIVAGNAESPGEVEPEQYPRYR